MQVPDWTGDVSTVPIMKEHNHQAVVDDVDKRHELGQNDEFDTVDSEKSDMSSSHRLFVSWVHKPGAVLCGITQVSTLLTWFPFLFSSQLKLHINNICMRLTTTLEHLSFQRHLRSNI